jgi:hypothetical protein
VRLHSVGLMISSKLFEFGELVTLSLSLCFCGVFFFFFFFLELLVLRLFSG